MTGSTASWVENRSRSGLFRLDLRELWAYREPASVMALRDVRVRYKQAALGIGWAVLQPLAGVLSSCLRPQICATRPTPASRRRAGPESIRPGRAEVESAIVLPPVPRRRRP